MGRGFMLRVRAVTALFLGQLPHCIIALSIVKEYTFLHSGLLFSIRTEENLGVLSHSIKCFGSLVQITPYRVIDIEVISRVTFMLHFMPWSIFSIPKCLPLFAFFSAATFPLNIFCTVTNSFRSPCDLLCQSSNI